MTSCRIVLYRLYRYVVHKNQQQREKRPVMSCLFYFPQLNIPDPDPNLAVEFESSSSGLLDSELELQLNNVKVLHLNF